MSVLFLLIFILSIFFVLWFAAGWYAFRAACGRGTELDLNDRERIRGTAWERYYKEIMRGIDWITSQPQEEIMITASDGVKLYGNLILNSKARGTVILFHGYRTFGSCDFSADADHYYGLGYHLLIVDQRACQRSGGRYITFGFLERKDCWSWIDYVTGRFGTAHEIFLGGLSLGASTVLMASGKPLPPQVKGIIADSAFTSPYDIISRTISHKYHVPAHVLMPVIEFWSCRLAGISLSEYSVLQAMETNQTPILFVHGKMDDYVPWEMSVRASTACQVYHEIFLVDGADHGTGYMIAPEQYRKKLTDFFLYCQASE